MQDYNAKLSDFGLARTGPSGDQTHVSTRVMGTYGYAAPEYVMTGKDGIPYIIRKQLLCYKEKNEPVLKNEQTLHFTSSNMLILNHQLTCRRPSDGTK